MNRQIAITKIETVIQKLTTNQSPEPYDFTGEFHQTFREEFTPILLKLFQNCRRNTPKLILWSHHYSDTKTRQRYHKKIKLQANITDKHRCKNPQQNISKLRTNVHLTDHTTGLQGFLYICKSNNVIHHIKNWKIKPYDHLNRCGESFWQNSRPILDKNAPENGHRGELPQYNKSHLRQTYS